MRNIYAQSTLMGAPNKEGPETSDSLAFP